MIECARSPPCRNSNLEVPYEEPEKLTDETDIFIASMGKKFGFRVPPRPGVVDGGGWQDFSKPFSGRASISRRCGEAKRPYSRHEMLMGSSRKDSKK